MGIWGGDFIKSEQFDNFFKNSNKQYNFDNFLKEVFCYHWHNRWDMNIKDNSIIKQLVQIIKERL